MATNKINNKAKKSKGTNLNVILLSVSLLIIIGLAILFFNRSGVIQGQVADADNTSNLLSDVAVSIDNKEPITNNLSGTFYIESIKPGNHNIKLTKVNYKPYEQDINLKAGEKLNINTIKMFQLPKEQATSNSKLLISSYNSSDITIITPALNNKTNDVVVVERPADMIALPEKNKIYCSSTSQSTISVVDSKNDIEIKKIKFDNGTQITKLQLSNSKDKLYVLGINSEKIFVVDTDKDQIIEPAIHVEKMASDFAIDSRIGNLVVLDTASLNVMSSSGAVISSHKFKKADFYDKVYLGLNYAIVTHSTNKFVIYIDLIDDKETKLDFLDKVQNVKVSLSGEYIYFLLSSSITILRSGSLEMYKDKIPTDGKRSNDMALSSDGSKLFITNQDSNNISIFDTKKEVTLPEKISLTTSPRRILQLF